MFSEENYIPGSKTETINILKDKNSKCAFPLCFSLHEINLMFALKSFFFFFSKEIGIISTENKSNHNYSKIDVTY